MMAFLQNAPMYVVPFLLVITVIVTIHELGHFLTARAFGVAVDRFSIGFGPTLWARRDKSGVEWRIAALPVGGYVRFAGDDNAASIPDGDDLEAMRAQIVAREGPGAEKKYLHFKPLYQRALIVAAGPLANFALAIALFSVFFGVFGEPMTPPKVASVAPGTPAEQAGFEVGDVITAIDGRPIRSFQELSFYVQPRNGVRMDIEVSRGGRTLHLTATPATKTEQAPGGRPALVGRLGIGATGVQWVRHGPVETVWTATRRTWDIGATTIYSIGRMVTGEVRADQIGSFIGMARASGDMTKQAIDTANQDHSSVSLAVLSFLIQFTAFLSVSVGLLNLMPVPVLDGGHLIFYAYESIARRPLPAGIQAASYRVGLALLLGLMLFATWNDLQLPRMFHFLGGLIS